MLYLNRFDSGDWSYYDDAGKPASLHYHNIHIEQLRRLYDYTREPVFKAYAERFSAYLTMPDGGGEGAGTDVWAGDGCLRGDKHG